MNVKELKDWLADVPDGVEIVGGHDNDESIDESYTCEPVYNEIDNVVKFILGI